MPVPCPSRRQFYMSLTDLPSRYNPKEIEAKWYSKWEASGFFTPKSDPKQKPFVIVIPPPNVTGMLHMGHALNNTIQDILIRWKRMQGVPALWLPGVDHAGIATQNVVERSLAKEGKSRHALGRERFIEEVWKWKNEYGSTIVRQLRRLGASCDWSRERFTMDEGLSEAVRETFVSLYEKGLIYRGDYIINWCPRCQTALSDEEAVHKEIEGSLYYIRYPVEGSDEQITVATTRPETMLGDTAVAVHPGDERYAHLKGRKVTLPLLNRPIPVIEDELVDPVFGTGIVKVTPAHDPNDFTMGLRHRLEFVNVLNPDGSINEKGGLYAGLDRFEARKRILHDLEQAGLFAKRASHFHAVGHCYRCHTVIEPYLSKQWFVKMKPLAEKALEAQRAGMVKFVPERWTKVYESWLENIRDWCISRQIWWGHRIPAWYCLECYPELGKLKLDPPGRKLDPNERMPVAHFEVNAISRTDAIPFIRAAEPKSCPKGHKGVIVQDPDVLDTWFSSWLWPFSTLGWPRETADLKYFYPTSVLVTAQEIIFFWVARMIMAGLQFRGEVPFQTVFIHGTVRVEGGKKMSKSLGNVIDPLEIIDQMGADALRFSITMLAATDVYLSRQKLELGRNFTNKIWNASRFVLTNLEGLSEVSETFLQEALSDFDKWILTELDETTEKVSDALSAMRFFDAANILYHFFWHFLCDWYLELVKPVLSGSEPPSERKKTAQAVLATVLEKSLRLLHPWMPFLTEEIWHLMKGRIKMPAFERESIMLSPWPEAVFEGRWRGEAERVRLFQDAVAGVRDLRLRLGLKPNELLPELDIAVKAEDARRAIQGFEKEILHFGRVERLEVRESIEKKKGWVGRIYGGLEIFAAGMSEESLKKEEEKTKKRIAELEAALRALDARLASSEFAEKAPAEVVAEERERKKAFEDELRAHKENLLLFESR